MNTHNQFTSSKERIHLLLVLFLSIIFCSCTKEDSPVSIEATSKVVTTRTSQDEYFEHAKLPQIIKIEWSQYIPFPPLLNIQIRQGQGKYDQIQLGASRDFDPNPVEYSFFPVREVLVQEGTYETIQIPVTDLQLPEGGGYIAVRATCSELVYDRPYPDKGPGIPMQTSSDMILISKSTLSLKLIQCMVLFVFVFHPIYLSLWHAMYSLQAVVIGNPLRSLQSMILGIKTPLFNGDTFLMIQKEMKYHLLIAQIIPTPVITMAQLFISQQLVIKQV